MAHRSREERQWALTAAQVSSAPECFLSAVVEMHGMFFKETVCKSKTSLQRSVLFLMCRPLGLTWPHGAVVWP